MKKESSMLKKITVVLLGVCVTSMTLTGVSAADFSDGMTEAAVEEDTFTDGSEGIKTESITAMVNDMAAHAQEKGQEYQKLKVQKNIAAERRASAERAKKIAAMVEESNRKVEQKRVAERKSLVNFALQFEGNPYVYGGTSLTNGADCSGFVMSVFKEFGYDLPRVAAAQYEASQKKDISQLETGDLVFYGAGGINHVALYIGNGKIVHASTAATGIKVSDYNYETPVGIGTYVE
ncbi:NlpC/P60 family protein [Blautia sp. BIOML-A1]|jgi:cell wall-associated NlpC family hydrolase|nr:NlpC/P60 family protein [Blautia sp. BIOML-A1]